MQTAKKIMLFSFVAVISLSVLASTLSPAAAVETPIWEGIAYSSGEEVTTPAIRDGILCRIEAEGIWWYDSGENLAADAQYYTTDYSNSWIWGNYFPAPDGHSFLQIDQEDVNWGTFSNGQDDNTGHKYVIFLQSTGEPLAFRIVDWVDGKYGNNECHIDIKIYANTIVGGTIMNSTPLLAAIPWIVAFSAFGALISALIIDNRRRDSRMG